MRTIETTLYQFDELPTERAKERARDWYREHVFTDSNDWGCVYEDAATVAEILGIDLRRKPVKLMNGSTRYDLAIYFSGFSSQGDGANFEGVYQYAKGATKKIRTCAPQDKELHRIADALQDVQRRHLYRLTASVLPKGHYFNMDVHVEDREHPCNDIGSAESEVRELMQDFAHWIYKQLENEYEYQISDEAVEDTIRANEYEFTENGERA